MRSLVVSCVVLISLLLVGCGSGREAQLVGSWTPEVQLTPEAEKNPMAGMLKNMISQMNLTLTADKRFAMDVPVMGKMEGTWTIAGDKLSIKADKVGGKTIEETKKQMMAMAATNPAAKANADKLDQATEFMISADNKTLTAIPDPSAPRTGTVTYKKKSQ